LFSAIERLTFIASVETEASGKKFFAMKRMTTDIVSSLLILLFGYTSLSKLLTIERFSSVLERMPLIGTGAGVLAFAIPLAELCIVLLLLFERTRYRGLILSLALLIAFTFYLTIMVLFTPHLPCSCGGVISKMSWKQHLFFNGAFIVATATSLKKKPGEKELVLT
jgi:hypothetical protein